MSFRVGDIVTGTPQSNLEYSTTTTSGTYKVENMRLSSSPPFMTIKVISHSDPKKIGNSYSVEPKYFKLVNMQDADNVI